MPTAALAVGLHRITKRFGDVIAVDNVDLEIVDGEFFALLGPSGCVKTTALRLSAGLAEGDPGHRRLRDQLHRRVHRGGWLGPGREGFTDRDRAIQFVPDQGVLAAL